MRGGFDIVRIPITNDYVVISFSAEVFLLVKFKLDKVQSLYFNFDVCDDIDIEK